MTGAVSILWTGGWDSTFRVLYLACVAHRPVEPHYIVDTTRPSALRELQAIANVKALLRERQPDAAGRIAPLRVTVLDEIPADTAITQAVRRLQQRAHLGFQYEWLARYAKSQGLTNLELSVHIDDKLYEFLKDHVDLSREPYRLRPDVTGDERIFAPFEFPVLQHTKQAMRAMAQAHGFLTMLEQSWFCHEPRHGRPCGVCNPCAYTMQEGMAYRLPRDARFRYHLRPYTGAVSDACKWGRQALANLTAVRRLYRAIRYGITRDGKSSS